jgi:hypothetical protein
MHQARIGPHIMRKRLAIVSACLAAAAVGALAVVAPRQQAFDPLTDAASLCTSDQPFSTELLGEPRHRFEVGVPLRTPLPGQGEAPSFTVSRGDILQVRVDAARGGHVAVHGILEEHRVKVNDAIHVKLQARYSGRFPLHFHGDDGSHFEVAVFEVATER